MPSNHAIQRDNEQPLDGTSSALNPSILEKSDTTRRSSSEGASITWGMDQLQEACLEKNPPGRKEGVIEGQYAIPLILQDDDELLEAQQGAISASAAADALAHTAGGHDELMYYQVFPHSCPFTIPLGKT
jgi:hypothetical protein